MTSVDVGCSQENPNMLSCLCGTESDLVCLYSENMTAKNVGCL